MGAAELGIAVTELALKWLYPLLILAEKKVILYDLMIETSNKQEGDDFLTPGLYLNLPAGRMP